MFDTMLPATQILLLVLVFFRTSDRLIQKELLYIGENIGGAEGD